MRLTELPDDMLLEVARYLLIDSCLALSQSFRAARILSQTSVLWWDHDITGIASYLEESKSLGEYTATELRTAAVKAHRTWASFKAPGARKSTSFRTPLEENRYEGSIPPGLPFHFALATYDGDKQIRLVCRDLGHEGRVIASYELPSNNDDRLEPKCLAVYPVDQQTVLAAILSQGEHSWYSPKLHILQVCIHASPESSTADFSVVVNFEFPHDWTPDNETKFSIRLPRCFHIHQGVVFWVQDIIDITGKQTFVSPLVTALKYSNLSQSTDQQIECQFGRWTCGRDQGLYTIGATLAADHIVLISDYARTRAFVVSLSTIFSDPFAPSQIDQPVSQQSPCFLPRPRDGITSGFRVDFDTEVEPISLSRMSILPGPSSVGYRLHAVILATAGNAKQSSTQVWWYTIFLHLSNTVGNPTATLRILAPDKGDHYAQYISKYGLTRGLLWCVPLGPESVLFLERKGRNRWPILRSADTMIELFDPLSGVVCAFTNPFIDTTPILSVSWFKGKRK